MEQTPNVTARVIIEMLGSPKDHVEKTIRDYVLVLKKDKNITLLKEDVADAQEQNGLYMAFVEMDIKFSTVNKLMDFCFESMPSSVEILEPQELSFDSSNLSSLLNDLQARLHQVDMSMKQLTAQSGIVDRNAMNVLHNFIKFTVKEGGKTAKELAPIVGIKEEQLARFLELMLDEGKLALRGDTYVAP